MADKVLSKIRQGDDNYIFRDQNAVHSVTASSNGKISVDGSDVTAYTHPTSAGNKHVPSGGSSGQFLGWDSAGTAKWVNNPAAGKADTATTLSGYGITDAYTKTETDTLLNGKVQVVATLPATGTTGTVYYVGPSGSGADQYDEYIWDATNSQFIKVGEKSVDLSDYLKKNGDGKDVTVSFTQAGSKANINSTESLATMFGKIKKWYASMGDLAWKSNVSDSDISGTISDTHIASASTWNAKQDALATQTAYTSKGTATKVPQITTNSLGQVTGITEVTISGVTPASHTHGNIQNGGTLQATDVTVADGDRLIVTDASDSNKIARTSVTFDGSTTTTALTPKGTFEAFAKSSDISSAINALDVSSVGGDGKYISAISETNGKISATSTSMDTAPTSGSTNAVTSDGIKTALDGKAASSHTHGNITNDGKIGSTANLPVITGTSGAVTTGSFATSTVAVATSSAAGTANTFSRGDHKHSISLATGDSAGQVKIAGSNVSVNGWANKAGTSLGNVTANAINNLYAITDGYAAHANLTQGYGLLATIDTTNFPGYRDIHAIFELYDLQSDQNRTGYRTLSVNIRNNASTTDAGSYVYKINQVIHEPVDSKFSLVAYRSGDTNLRLYSVGLGASTYGGMLCKLVSCTAYYGTSEYSRVTLGRGNATSTVPTGTEVSITTETEDVSEYRTIPQDISKGANLVVNGNGLLGNNYNFSSAEFIADTDLPTGVAGCFKRVANNTWCDEVISVNTSKVYQIEAWYRVKSASTSTVRLSTACLDIDKKEITAVYSTYGVGTLTTLTQDLKPGDTVVHLDDLSGANWLSTTSYHRGFIVWNYKNSYGYQYPPETYSRNVYPSGDSNPLWDVENINVANGTITLNNAWSGPTIPAGTYLSRRNSGSTYYYAAYSATNGAFTTWTRLSGLVKNFVTPGDSGGGAFRPGTAFLKVGWVNGNTTGNEWFEFAGIELREVPESAAKLTTARKLKTNLARTADSTFDGSADQTNIPVTGTLPVGNGGTGKASVTANSYLKGNGTGALVERTYAEVRTDLGISAGANKVEASTTNGNIKIDGTDTTVYTHPTQTAYTSKGTATKVPQITTDSTGHVTGITEVTISGVTPASHTHGNIQNGGTLQTTDITIASGDKLVVTDNSDSNKVARASVSFDGSTTTTALTPKGTFEAFAKSGDITSTINALDAEITSTDGTNVQAKVTETNGKITAVNITTDDTANYVDSVYYVVGTTDYAAWVANHAYAVGDNVISGGKAYTCKTAHTSGSSFSSTYWTAIATPVLKGSVPGVSALYTGMKIAYKWSITGGTSSTYLNINGLGNVYIRRNDSNTTTHVPANSVTFLAYDGTYWRWSDYDANSTYSGMVNAYLNNAADAAKTATSTNFKLTTGITIILTNNVANTKAAALTLNVNSTGAKTLYIDGTVSSATNYTIPAGTYFCHYDGTNWQLWTNNTFQATNFKGTLSGSATSAGKLTTARKTYVTLGTASTTTTRDWSGDTTIPVDGTLGVGNGGTGKSSVTSNSFLVGNGSSAMVEKTPAEVLALIGAQATITYMTSSQEDSIITELGDL